MGWAQRDLVNRMEYWMEADFLIDEQRKKAKETEENEARNEGRMQRGT